MKRGLWFALTSAVVIGLAAWAGAAFFHDRIGQEGVRAIVMSAGVAFTVQCLTFGIGVALMPSSFMLGLAARMLVRFFTVVLHGFVGVMLMGLSAEPAMYSLVAFLILTTFVEPFFLPPPAVSTPAAKPPDPPPARTS